MFDPLFDLGPHASFITISYILVVAVIAGLILWVRIDYARQRKDLAELEARGITRRSQDVGGQDQG
ncbi:heme exporter protein CcmD [Stappia sp. F7233]|uniref:Heme exporter protein D n=1 Tax=Stappia albiluteola TaxID=2758565 RepID=A0A839AJF4_9HYPH|nr:heme exporter protein CcmD [Stappia albiluteola]MBA5778629.1 heme exporter protein CcmD [Stappia albiluteola]